MDRKKYENIQIIPWLPQRLVNRSTSFWTHKSWKIGIGISNFDLQIYLLEENVSEDEDRDRDRDIFHTGAHIEKKIVSELDQLKRTRARRRFLTKASISATGGFPKTP